MRRMAWVGLLALVLASVATFAGDGIPVGNAVFYPAVEAVYTHTDNLFLLDSSMPGGNTDDSFWVVRPSIGIEVPLDQSYFRFDLAYQYKDYQDFHVSKHNAWFASIDSNFKFSNGAQITFRDHFVNAVQEVNQFDPGYEATFNNTPFDRNYAQLGFNIPVNKLNTLGFGIGYNYVNFRNSDTRQPFYDYNQLEALANWKYHYNANNSVVAEYTYTDSNEDHPAYGNGMSVLPYINRDYKSHKFMTGWEGSFTAKASGSALVGYEEMNFDNRYDDFSGFVGKANLGFKFSEFVRADLNLFRQPYQSAYNVNNYYTTSGGEFQVEQQVTRYFFWTAGYLYQRNKYPEVAKGDVNGDGLLDSPLYLLPWSGLDRRDTISRARAEVGFHFTQQISLRVNYQYEDRNSNVSYVQVAKVYRPYSYKENRFAFQVQLGW